MWPSQTFSTSSNKRHPICLCQLLFWKQTQELFHLLVSNQHVTEPSNQRSKWNYFILCSAFGSSQPSDAPFTGGHPGSQVESFAIFALVSDETLRTEAMTCHKQVPTSFLAENQGHCEVSCHLLRDLLQEIYKMQHHKIKT